MRKQQWFVVSHESDGDTFLVKATDQKAAVRKAAKHLVKQGYGEFNDLLTDTWWSVVADDDYIVIE